MADVTPPTNMALRDAVINASRNAKFAMQQKGFPYPPDESQLEHAAADAAIAAVIATMREPSEAMLISARDKAQLGPMCATECWQTMLTAFIADKGD